MGILDDISNSLATGGQLTPAGQGLLAAGLGILAHNRGLTSGAAAIGLGGQEGLATFQGAQQQQLARQLGQQQLIQAQLQNRMLGGKIDFATGMQPGAQGAAAAPQPTPNPLAPLGGMGATPASMQGMAQSAAAQAPQQEPEQPSQAQNPFAPGGSFNPLGLDEQTARGMFLYDPNYAKNFVAPAYAPTDAQRAARAAGLQMGTPEYQSFMQGAATKQNYIPPVSGRPGGYLAYANGQQEQLPHVPNGFTAVQDQSGRWNIVPVPGAIDAISSSEAAQARGKGQYALQKVFDDATRQDKLQTVTNVADAAAGGTSGAPSLPAPIRNNNPGALMPGGKLAQYSTPQEGLAALDDNLTSYGKQGVNTVAGVISKWAPPNENNTQAYIADVSQRLGMKPNQPIDLSNPYARHALSTAIMLHENGTAGVFGYPGHQGTPTGAGPAPQGYPGAPGGSTPPARSGAFSAGPPLGMQAGAQAGATNLQNELSKKWTALNDQNTQAATTNSYLQSIKSLAGQAATGAQADRINYVNGLLSLAGSERATDMVTANNLLDKYSNQIVARLGQGGLGTDAARSILQSAYPNAHMTPQAINEAADNLVGANQMVQAKTRLLQPYANDRDAQSYNNLETRFDQNADPRVWQYANMTDPAQRQAFAKKMVQQDPKFEQKLRNLESMGAFQ